MPTRTVQTSARLVRIFSRTVAATARLAYAGTVSASAELVTGNPHQLSADALLEGIVIQEEVVVSIPVFDEPPIIISGTTGAILYKGANEQLAWREIPTDWPTKRYALTISDGLATWAETNDASGVFAGWGFSWGTAWGYGQLGSFNDTRYDAKGDLIAGTGPDVAAKLTVGANNKFLQADSTQDTGLKWGDAIMPTLVDAKGDLIAGTANDAVARLAVGADNKVLQADSSQATGLKWGDAVLPTLVDAKGDLLVGTANDTVGRLAVGTNGFGLVADSAQTAGVKWQARDVAIPIVIGDGTNVIPTGLKLVVEVPFACTIIAARLVSNDGTSGSIVVDVWKDTYANSPPTVADTITASAKPTLSSAVRSEDVTLAGWTTAISAGDWLAFNVDSATTVKLVTLSLTLRRS